MNWRSRSYWHVFKFSYDSISSLIAHFTTKSSYSIYSCLLVEILFVSLIQLILIKRRSISMWNGKLRKISITNQLMIWLLFIAQGKGHWPPLTHHNLMLLIISWIHFADRPESSGSLKIWAEYLIWTMLCARKSSMTQ